MKRHLLSIFLLVLSLPLFAAEPEKAAPVVAKPAHTDAFLDFALEKAKLYSGAVEDAIGKGVDLAAKEAPETFAQLIRWRIVKHAIHGVLPPIFLILSLVLFAKQWPKWKEGDYGDGLAYGTAFNVIGTFAGAIGTFGFFIGTVVTACPNLMSLLQIIVAPRIYVIEQVIDLAKR